MANKKASKRACPKGTRKLKQPVWDNGVLRECTLPKKTAVGRKRDYRKTSTEAHEVKYRRLKKQGKR